jgi:flagellar biosynthesis protein FliQ
LPDRDRTAVSKAVGIANGPSRSASIPTRPANGPKVCWAFAKVLRAATTSEGASPALAGRSRAQAMTGAEVLEVGRDTILTLVLAAGPLMLVGLLVGVVVSLFQALTQIQEMTLVFVPKIIALFITLLIMLPFIGDLLEAYMARLVARIIGG